MALLDTVRKASRSAIWSQGVELAQRDSVFVASRSAREVTARVRSGGPVPPTVTLFLEDEEWSCDCDSRVDPCAHVIATAIALAKAGAASATAGSAVAERSATTATMAYSLSRAEGTLYLERLLVRPDGTEECFEGSLATLVARGRAPLLPSQEDLTLDRVIACFKGDAVPAVRTRELLGALASARDVRLDGVPVGVSKERVLPRAVVEDHPRGGAVLRLERDPRVREVVARGVVRVGMTLHPMGETASSGDLLERLPAERVFAREQLGELVAQVLPELEKQIVVERRTRRVPQRMVRMAPRLHVELTQGVHPLSVLATLVYGDPPIARVDGDRLVTLGRVVPERIEPAEKALTLRLRDELHLVPGRRADFDAEGASRFLTRLKAFRHDGAGETLGEVFGRRALVPRFVVEDERFDVLFDLEPSGPGTPDDERPEGDGPPAPQRASAAAVLRAYREGLDVVPLEGGGFAPLPADWMSRFGDRVAALLAARDEDGKVARAALPALAELCDEIGSPRPAALTALRPLFESFEALPEPQLPKDLAADLRPYQRTGVAWLSFLRDVRLGAVLADDMGLGKTLQTLAAMRGRALVVCPRSVLFNWQAEAMRFRPEMRVAVYHGAKRELDASAALTLTTYAVLRLDGPALAAVEWDAVVLDEAQAIKNPDSQVARAAYTLRAGSRVALSGTPVENRLEELWSLMHFANRGLLGGRSEFRERYEAPIALGNAERAAQLRRVLRPFLLRRMKNEVARELPPRTDTVLHVELSDEERAVYEGVRAATRKEVVARLREGGSVLQALEALLRMRQAACHSGLVPGQHAASSSKVEALVGALDQAAADGHKAIVFSQWTSLLDRVEPHLTGAGLGFTRLDGTTQDRGAVVETFQRQGGPPVLLASLKAGGTGINLTAADHVFLLDPWWNPAAEDQAADRAHRIGQDKPVFVYRLVAKDTVEEGILALQVRKRAVADAALGEGGAAASLTRDDLLALLE